MKKYVQIIVFLLFSLIMVSESRALVPTIDVLSHGYVDVYIQVNNHTAQPITFNLTASVCVSVAPGSFTIPANGKTSITVTWRFRDQNWDSCYTAHHFTSYEDAAGNNFSIRQLNSSEDPRCADIKFFAVFYIHQAVCPETFGNMTAGTAQEAMNNMYFYFGVGGAP